MTVILEWCGPWQWRPGRFRSRVLTRVWWGYWALAVLHVPLDEFTRTAYDWQPQAAREEGG